MQRPDEYHQSCFFYLKYFRFIKTKCLPVFPPGREKLAAVPAGGGTAAPAAGGGPAAPAAAAVAAAPEKG